MTQPTGEFPSIDLAYQRAQTALDNQLTFAGTLESKVALLWAVATAVIGIGVPFALQTNEPFAEPFSWLLWLTLASFAAATIVTMIVYFPARSLNFVTDLAVIRDKFWGLPREKFLFDMSVHMGNVWSNNEGRLVRTGWAVRSVHVFVLLEVLSLLAWLWLSHWKMIG